MSYPQSRPRRLRRTPAIRRLVRETRLDPAQLVLPMFVREGISAPKPIVSMPGVFQHTRDSLKAAATEAVKAGVGGLMLFGVPAERDARGSGAVDPGGILNVGIADLISEVGDSTVIMADGCLDEFTDHGHCGVLDEHGTVDNDETLKVYAEMALAQAAAGAHMVGPSGMMDGQIGVMRQALDADGYQDVSLIAYAAKYASALYGPFREAVDSQLKGDRRTYQQDPANAREALRELQQDVDEGADIVIVKPATSYLDVISMAHDYVNLPVAAYQVSGEYAMVEAAAANGWLDRERMIDEQITSIVRAGADIVLTYWAVEVARRLHG